ncbi:hypothetical protein HanXRQr2_Chr17g0811381 [Helianthus annuus]|uniref:Uncharacterized protein n=1 Tax=Helianthus annuus TaxID=4232 RepID=A0A9K3GUZ6_HELAN|nr:hypothetical protein HanXRQr2_Chr17g0811381 [Helianthus annuus]
MLGWVNMSWVVLIYFYKNVLKIINVITDCWAEPQDRPSCEEILTRLLDCDYTLS